MKFRLPATKLCCNYLLLTMSVSALLLLTTSAHADNSMIVNQLQSDASQKKLWQQSEWINLLHFEGDGDTADDFKSSIRDKDFFLADDGSNNSESELNATITGFYDTELKGDQHPQCRYVARFNWLSTKLAIDASTLPAVKCEKYKIGRAHV